jgi:integrase
VLAANAKPLWLRALIACAYSFGFRKSELLTLRCSQVDLEGGWVQLYDTKNDEWRKVKLTKECALLLAACKEDKAKDNFIFTRENGERVMDPRDDWYSLCIASGLGEYVPAKRANGKTYQRYGLNCHDFRRAAIRNMTRRGVSQTVAMRISGHKTASVFRRYDISDEPDLVDASRKIELGRQVSTPESPTDTKTDTATYAHS